MYLLLMEISTPLPQSNQTLIFVLNAIREEDRQLHMRA